MNIESLLGASIDGLMLGFIYGLAAMGLTLIFGVMRVINLAHGPVIMLGMYTVYVLTSQFGWNPYLSIAFAVLLGLVFGVVMYFIAVHKVINAPELTTLLATFSVNLMIVGIATVVFTTTPHTVDVQLPSFRTGVITIQVTRVVSALIAIIVTASLYYFLYRTRIGKSIRAVSNNRNAAELMGINTSAILGLSFGLGTMLAAVSGGLIATLFGFNVLSGGGYETKSFVIVVLGGLGNPTGALFGGIFLGLLEGITTMYLPLGWVPVIEYVIFVIILLVRPSGLLGAR